MKKEHISVLRDRYMRITSNSQKYTNPSFTISSVKPLNQLIIIFVNNDNLIKITFHFVLL